MRKHTILFRISLFTVLILFAINSIAQKDSSDCRVLLSSISKIYKGDCKDNFANGNGIASGIDKYEGKFKNGLPHGFGKYTWKNGNIYEGKWKAGERHGKGVLYSSSNGEKITGYWKKNVFVKELTESKYQVLSKTANFSKISITKADSEEWGVQVIVYRDGRVFNSFEEFELYGSSGSTRETVSFKGLDHIIFPFNGTLSFSCMNHMYTSIHRYDMKFRLEDKGYWTVKVYL